MSSILIENGILIADPEGKEILEDGSVFIEGNRIVEVGPSASLKAKYQPQIRLNAAEKLILPGFINGHSHLEASMRRGLFDDREECVSWLSRLYSWFYPQIDEEVYYYGSLLTLMEAIKTGTTTLCECGAMPGMEPVAMQAISQIGARAVVGRMTWDTFGESTVLGFPERLRETTQQALERGEEFVKKYHNSLEGRVQAWLCLMQVPNVSDDLCQKSKDIVDKYGSGLMTHGAVTSAMVKLTKDRFGLPDIERLGALGVLAPNLLVAHAGWLTGKELLLLKEHGVSVAHCLSSSMKGAYGSVSHGWFPEMTQMGINVCLGTDSASSSNHLDMVRQLNLAATAHKEARLDPSLFPAWQVLPMATVNGARAFRLENELGVLAPGKKADLIIFDLHRIGWVPYGVENLVQNLIYSASGESVDTVIIDGQVVMENGRLAKVDEGEVRARCQKIFKKIVSRADWLRKPA